MGTVQTAGRYSDDCSDKVETTAGRDVGLGPFMILGQAGWIGMV